MTGARPIPVLPAVSATILTAAALYFGSGIFAPVAVSLFLIAILWPMQKALESRIPRLIALLLTLAATVVVLFSFGWMISWGYKYFEVRHPRFHIQFTPISASWVNQVKRFFRNLSTPTDTSVRRKMKHYLCGSIGCSTMYRDPVKMSATNS